MVVDVGVDVGADLDELFRKRELRKVKMQTIKWRFIRKKFRQ